MSDRADGCRESRRGHELRISAVNVVNRGRFLFDASSVGFYALDSLCRWLTIFLTLIRYVNGL